MHLKQLNKLINISNLTPVLSYLHVYTHAYIDMYVCYIRKHVSRIKIMQDFYCCWVSYSTAFLCLVFLVLFSLSLCISCPQILTHTCAHKYSQFKAGFLFIYLFTCLPSHLLFLTLFSKLLSVWVWVCARACVAVSLTCCIGVCDPSLVLSSLSLPCLSERESAVQQ